MTRPTERSLFGLPAALCLLLATLAASPSTRAGDILSDGAITGAWFDPAHEGAGFLIETLPDDTAVVYWFTYDDAGDQRWLVGVGSVAGNELVIDAFQATRGARFGDAFDPADVERIEVGSATFRFDDCASGQVAFTIDGSPGNQPLVRLTGIADQGCSEGRLAAGNDLNQTGSWFNPDRSGEGVIVEVLDETTAFINWFTYDDQGEQAWFTGIGRVAGRRIHVAELLKTAGGRFGPDHDPSAVTRQQRGQLELDLGCSDGELGYDTDLGSSRIDLVRLTAIAGLGCEEDRYTEADSNALIGNWTSDGFGMAAGITASGFVVYQYTAQSCLPVLSGTLTDLAMAGAELTLNQDGDRARFLGLDAVSPVFFERRSQLPVPCRNGGTAFTSDLAHNFDVFAATFDELYATFDVRQVDWDSQVQQARSQLGAVNERQLFDLMANAIDPLNDGHVSLIAPFGRFNAGGSPENSARFERANRPIVTQIIRQYLDGAPQLAVAGALTYGMIDGTVGYLQIGRFYNLYPGVPTETALERFADDIDGVLGFLDDQGAESLIIDVRRNDGGDSKFGYELAKRFYGDRSRLVFSERRPNESGLSAAIETAIGPSERVRFEGPVAVLTSRLTASAAEIFTLAMRARPGTVLIGEPTFGVLSKTERVLPNGWIVSVTPGIVYAPDGSVYEATGVPVDEFAATFPQADLDAQVDRGIDTALEVLGR